MSNCEVTVTLGEKPTDWVFVSVELGEGLTPDQQLLELQLALSGVAMPCDRFIKVRCNVLSPWVMSLISLKWYHYAKALAVFDPESGRYLVCASHGSGLKGWSIKVGDSIN